MHKYYQTAKPLHFLFFPFKNDSFCFQNKGFFLHLEAAQ